MGLTYEPDTLTERRMEYERKRKKPDRHPATSPNNGAIKPGGPFGAVGNLPLRTPPKGPHTKESLSGERAREAAEGC